MFVFIANLKIKFFIFHFKNIYKIWFSLQYGASDSCLWGVMFAKSFVTLLVGVMFAIGFVCL